MKNTNTRKQSKAERSNKSSGECWAVMKHLYPDQAAPNIRPDQPSHYYSATVLQYSSATDRQPVQGAHGTVHIVPNSRLDQPPVHCSATVHPIALCILL